MTSQRALAERWRLTPALLLSLLIHGALLSLTFSGHGLGLPGFGFPWQERRADAQDLRMVLLPAPAQPARQADTPHASVSEPPPLEIPITAPTTPPPVITSPFTNPVTSPPPDPITRPPESEATHAAGVTKPKALAAIKTEPTPESDAVSYDKPQAPPPVTPPSVITDRIAAETQKVAVQEDSARHNKQVIPETSELAQPLAPHDVRESRSPDPIDQTRLARLEAERLEAQQQEAAHLAALRAEAAALEAVKLETARAETARLEAEQRTAQRLAAERLEAQRQEAARQAAERAEAARREAERLAAERLAAERLEAQRQEAARHAAERAEAAQREAERRTAEHLAAERLEAQRQEAARQAAERAEVTRREAERRAAEQRAATQKEAARLREIQEEDARREARRRALGRQLDEEAARREHASAARDNANLPYSWSTARRARLWGRVDPNLQLVQYAEGWARKLEFNTPVETVRDLARRPHSNPLVTVAIRSDGTVESVTFILSSGNLEVDAAVRRIIEASAPYQAFPPALANDYDVVEIRRSWQFDNAIRLY